MEEIREIDHVPPNVVEESSMSDSINEIAAALSQAQGELEAAKKDSSGFGYQYSNLAEVINSAKPTLAKHGLAVVQLLGSTNNNQVAVTTLLTHKSGQFFKSVATLPIVSMKGCNSAQEYGSSASYLRRYSYQAIIGQPSEDLDASSNGLDKPKSSGNFKKEAKPAAKKAEPKKETKASSEKPNFRRTKKADAKPAAGVL
jgi:hypothetical protein